MNDLDRHSGTPPRQRLRLARRQLLFPLSPMTNEKLDSYLGRLERRNLLQANWAQRLSHDPDRTRALSELTGLSEKHLVSALPDLRTPEIFGRWPYLAGQVSANAGVRPACTHCTTARIGPKPPVVSVYTRHEDLICHRHKRWLGSPELKCAADKQFSLRETPDIVETNHQHRGMIKHWGRPSTNASFQWAVICFSRWSRWRPVLDSPDIARRWTILGITDNSKPGGPLETAAWYPNAVALTAIILSSRQRRSIPDHSARQIVTDSLMQLQAVIPGIAPSGAGDPFRQAIFNDRSSRTR